MVGTELQANTQHIPYVRHSVILAIWKTHKQNRRRQIFTPCVPFPTLFTSTLDLYGIHPHASELQYTAITAVVKTVVYRSNTGIVGSDHIRGVDMHLRLICLCIALCRYRPCGRPIPSPGKHIKCIEILNGAVPGHIGLWHNRDNENWRLFITW